MGLSKEILLTVKDYEVKLNKDIKFYENDTIDLCFSILEYGIEVKNGMAVNKLMPINALKAYMLIETPQGVDYAESTKVEDNRVVFNLGDKYSQFVGIGKMQIVIKDNDGCRITLPEFPFEIRQSINSDWDRNITVLSTEASEIIIDEFGREIGLKKISEMEETNILPIDSYSMILDNNENKKIKTNLITQKIENDLQLIDEQLNNITQQIMFDYDNYIKLNFVSDDGHFSAFDGSKICNGDFYLRKNGNSGFITNGWNNNIINLTAPIGVCIGDSIMEGHPATHGRLHNSNGIVDLNKDNKVGQLSYHLEQMLHIPIVNHGIGGQSYDQIRARWERDVLAQDISSLAPSKTLDYKPYFVVLGTGINDIFKGRTVQQMKDDMLFFINSCKENNIKMIIFNCGTHRQNDVDKIARIKEFNEWLKVECSNHKHANLIDFYNLTNNPSNDGYPKDGVFIDDIHPTRQFQQELSKYIIDTVFNMNYIPKPTNICFSFMYDESIDDSGSPNKDLNKSAKSVIVTYNDKYSFIYEFGDVNLCTIPLKINEILKDIKIEVVERTEGVANAFISEICLSNTELGGIIEYNLEPKKINLIPSIGKNRVVIFNGTGFEFCSSENYKKVVGSTSNTTVDGLNLIYTKYAYLDTLSTDLVAGGLIKTSTGGRISNCLPSENAIGEIIRIYKSNNTNVPLVRFY